LQGGKRPALKSSIVALLSQRDHFMTEIEAQRSRAGASVGLHNKAGALLTRFWARADWPEREEILKTVGWLLKVARLQSSTTPANGAREKKNPSRRQLKIEALAPVETRPGAEQIKGH
jgi:hypothetical protein